MANQTPQVATSESTTQNLKLMPGANFVKSVRRLTAGTILKITIPDQSAATIIDVILDLKLYPVEVD